MTIQNFEALFTPQTALALFPEKRTNQFFDALFGDENEGAYNISLKFIKQDAETLHFEFQLQQRPGTCLSCSLTYGLPQVFQRHPVINIKGIVAEIERLLGCKARCVDWKLGSTREVSPQCHTIPFSVFLEY